MMNTSSQTKLQKKSKQKTMTSKRTSSQITDDPTTEVNDQLTEPQPSLVKKRRKERKSSNKKTKTNSIIKIKDFDLVRDVMFLPLQKHEGYSSIKLYNRHTEGPD
jgi:hypothetical protein